MPSRYGTYPEHALVVASIWGHVNADKLRGLVSSYWAGKECDPVFDYLIDLSGVTGISLSFADMQSFVDLQNKLLSGRHDRARTALYAQDDKTYGFARMYVSITAEISSRPIAAFRTRQEALDYLGRDCDPRDADQTAAHHDPG